MENLPSFPRKRGKAGEPRTYAGSKLFIEQALARYDDWTPDEIEQRRQRIREWAVERWHVEPPEAPVPEKVSVDPSSVQAIQHVLTRAFIPYGQMTLYHALYEAGERGLSKTELADEIRGGDTRSLTGVLGALGNRINQSSPFEAQLPGIGLFFDISRQDGDWHYRMRPQVREAIEAMPGLCEAVQWPLDQIRETYRDSWWSDHAAQRQQLSKSDQAMSEPS